MYVAVWFGQLWKVSAASSAVCKEKQTTESKKCWWIRELGRDKDMHLETEDAGLAPTIGFEHRLHVMSW